MCEAPVLDIWGVWSSSLSLVQNLHKPESVLRFRNQSLGRYICLKKYSYAIGAYKKILSLINANTLIITNTDISIYCIQPSTTLICKNACFFSLITGNIHMDKERFGYSWTTHTHTHTYTQGDGRVFRWNLPSFLVRSAWVEIFPGSKQFSVHLYNPCDHSPPA